MYTSTKLKNNVVHIVLLSWAFLLQLDLDHFALAADITKEELLTVCPGELVSLTCTHDNVAGGQTRWQVSGPMPCVALVPHDAGLQEDVCGPFIITMISDNSGSTLSSTIQIPATETTVVTCLAGGSASSSQAGNTTLNVIDINVLSVTNWTANMRTNSLCPVLEWNPLDAPYQRCVTGYSVNLNGTVYNTTNTSLSIVEDSLPYCETQTTVTVTPFTLNRLLSPDTSNITVINPDSRTPALSTSFVIQNEVLKLQIIFQEISSDFAPIRMFGYIMSGEDCVPTTSFNGGSVVIDFSDQSPGDAYTVCVMFRNKDCSAFNSTSVTIPATIITVQEVTPSGTNYTIRLSLPFTGYPPSDLLIVSTLSPPHSDPIILPFPYNLTNQITVTFTDLTPGVFYTYTIRVVLASNQSNDVVFPVTREFSLTTSGGGGGGESTFPFPVAAVAGVLVVSLFWCFP